MKPILLLCSALWLLVGCADKPTLSLDPGTQLMLNGIEGLPSLAASKVKPPAAPYSIDTIVRYAHIWSFNTRNTKGLEGGIGKDMRDFATKRIKVGMSYEVVKVNKEGVPELGWILTDSIHDIVLCVKHLEAKPNEWYDVMADNSGVFTNQQKDTIGYIPNRVVRAAETKILEAFAAGNYDRCWRLFQDAYVFIPTTGAEWRALKAKNEQ